MTIDRIEYFNRLNEKLRSSTAKNVLKNIVLRNRKTNEKYNFTEIFDKEVPCLQNPIVRGFDMSKLEVEYDYDTDEEQITHSTKMLLRELEQAIEYFVMEDPLKLVDNIRL